MTYLSANCSLKSVYTLKKKNAKERFKVWLAYSAIQFVVEMHFKDANKDAQQKRHHYFF